MVNIDQQNNLLRCNLNVIVVNYTISFYYDIVPQKVVD
jgi:hypothetical protein